MSNQPALKLVPSPDRHRPLPRAIAVDDEVMSPLWSAPPTVEGVVAGQLLQGPAGSLPREIENALIVTLARPKEPGETYAVDAARREVELRAQLANLDSHQAACLKRRLEVARAGDPLCTSFHRLVVERRQRLLTFLGDARRRLAQGRP